MHESVMEFGRQVILPGEVIGKDILEVGSMNVNGTLGSVVQPYKPNKYVGTDMRAGTGVDVVVPAEQLVLHFGYESFDMVICTEMLEHCKPWKDAVQNIVGVCKTNGVIILTARGPGAGYHSYPEDFWRFTLEDIYKVFCHNQIEALKSDLEYPGFLAKIRKISPKVFTSFEVLAVTC